MEEFITSIEGYITLLGPSIVSVVTMIASIVVAIAKIKASTESSIAQVKELKKTVAQQVNAISNTTTSNIDLTKQVEEMKAECIACLTQNEQYKASVQELQSALLEANELIKKTNNELNVIKKQLAQKKEK